MIAVVAWVLAIGFCCLALIVLVLASSGRVARWVSTGPRGTWDQIPYMGAWKTIQPDEQRGERRRTASQLDAAYARLKPALTPYFRLWSHPHISSENRGYLECREGESYLYVASDDLVDHDISNEPQSSTKITLGYEWQLRQVVKIDWTEYVEREYELYGWFEKSMHTMHRRHAVQLAVTMTIDDSEIALLRCNARCDPYPATPQGWRDLIKDTFDSSEFHSWRFRPPREGTRRRGPAI